MKRINRLDQDVIVISIIIIVSYLAIGYFLSEMFFLEIDWIEDVTVAQKLLEYYVTSFVRNIIPTIIMSIIAIKIYYRLREKK